MTDSSGTKERAVALRAMLAHDLRQPDVEEALVACCSDLIEVGEFATALGLLDEAEKPSSGRDVPKSIRLILTRIRILSSQWASAEALTLVRMVKAHFLRDAQPKERDELLVWEGKCLWQSNRIAESIDHLQEVRKRLLGQQDSRLLASCSLELSAAYVLSGNLVRAREFSLDAQVSARRCEDFSILGTALANYAFVERMRCHWSCSADALHEAVDCFSRVGNRTKADDATRGLGINAWKQGRRACTEFCVSV
jgi:hypothetical protein